jgi:type VI secretion system secreted protein VgrG
MLLQAQKNNIRLEADQSVEVSASNQHVLVSAKEHITLMCGGAYITLKGGNIELGMPGNLIVKAAKHSLLGATSLEAELPKFKVGDTQRRFMLKQIDGTSAMPNMPYKITLSNGEVVEGVTDAQGATQLLQKDVMSIANVAMLKPPAPAAAGAAGGGAGAAASAAGAGAADEAEEIVQFFEFKDDQGGPAPHHFKVMSAGEVVAEGSGERTPEFPSDLQLELESWPVKDNQNA